MKRSAALLALGLVGLVAQSALALTFPAWLCPDFVFLVVVALGLGWRNTFAGLSISAFLGYATDLLSGSLLGQHMLLRIATFGAARLGGRGLDLRSALPRVCLTAGLTVVNALALWGLVRFFGRGVGPGFVPVGELLGHALINGAFIVPVAAAVDTLVKTLGDEEGQRLMRLEPRNRAA